MKHSNDDTGTVAGHPGTDPDVPSTRTGGSADRGRSPAARRRWQGVAVVGVTLMASLTVLQPAHADTRRFSDRAGDSGLPADLTTVRVSNGAEVLKVAVRPGRVQSGDEFTFWLDTRPKNPGPEYEVGLLPNSDGFGMLRVDAFGDQGTPVRCDDLRGTADIFAPAWVSIVVPRSCVRRPGKVRVAVQARYADGNRGVVDWAPARRTFFGWVAR
jgi:hypothetical protein